ncbi:zf-DHHC-domain-containing protein [Rhizopogon vinicolor AM-OR11-026]|uniref:Palmitoyltransferase n=1 Tax=Rhizopogon vinicolor AM-OR11-026 TaxID=1314800 RepID=A0A1B7NHG0_9AGAM|nr:zf-DHHC-domain-containing protein [Rhizopogon vinicolor AM-OR11-026]
MSRLHSLLSCTSGRNTTTVKQDDFDSEERKSWINYVPLCFLVFFMVAPHPSLLIILINYHLRTLHAPITFIIHLLITYTLTFLAFSSLIVCLARDPGPTCVDDSDEDSDGQHVGLTEALMSMEGDNDFTRFCRKCWVPKPDRAHHCSICNRCVLKMDHHCPWLGGKCIGFRTYPAFVHFLACITALSAYIATISVSAFWWSFNHSFLVLVITPLHELFLATFSVCITLVVGSFLVYHIHLITTNQTTVESLSPFLLLRHIPPLPVSMKLSDPPEEEELSYSQRKAVRKAHKSLRMYDVGWRRNWAQVFGWSKPRGWISRLIIGGSGKGDGRSFPRNPRSQEMLSQLAERLEKEA